MNAVIWKSLCRVLNIILQWCNTWLAWVWGPCIITWGPHCLLIRLKIRKYQADFHDLSSLDHICLHLVKQMLTNIKILNICFWKQIWLLVWYSSSPINKYQKRVFVCAYCSLIASLALNLNCKFLFFDKCRLKMSI